MCGEYAVLNLDGMMHPESIKEAFSGIRQLETIYNLLISYVPDIEREGSSYERRLGTSEGSRSVIYTMTQPLPLPVPPEPSSLLTGTSETIS